MLTTFKAYRGAIPLVYFWRTRNTLPNEPTPIISRSSKLSLFINCSAILKFYISISHFGLLSFIFENVELVSVFETYSSFRHPYVLEFTRSSLDSSCLEADKVLFWDTWWSKFKSVQLFFMGDLTLKGYSTYLRAELMFFYCLFSSYFIIRLHISSSF